MPSCVVATRGVVVGLRNPCGQLNDLADGLLDAVTGRADDGSLIRLAGVMAGVV